MGTVGIVDPTALHALGTTGHFRNGHAGGRPVVVT